MRSTTRVAQLALALAAALLGCASMKLPPLATEPHVDLPRFMGDWYVIANIPTSPEKGAFNAVESYTLEPDGRIATTFRFRQDGFDGEPKECHPTGFVRDKATNATWGMQFVWPFEAEYLILYVDPGYTQTVVGRNDRDYVWIMARTPEIPEADYDRLVRQIGAWGYDTARIERVPQRW